MYEPFYGLRERPFDLSPNPLYLFMTKRHAEALTTLTYGISARKGIALVIGEAGTGKTTLVHAALGTQEGRNALGVCLSNPTLSRTEFFEFLAHGFGLGPFTSKTTLLHSLRKCLISRHQKKAATALIIDEAQSLSDELLEEVRLLANIETTTDKLLSVVLLGQPELSARLNQGKLQQLKQRVAMRAVLAPLNSAECSAYISKRIAVAGGDGTAIFSEAAVDEIFRHSGGIPRAINVICDNALVSGFALDRRVIDRDVVLEVCRDLDFKASERPTPAKPVEQASKAAVEQQLKAAVGQSSKAAVEQQLKAAVGQSPKAAVEQPQKAAVEQAPKAAVEQAPKAAVEQPPKAAVEQAPKAAVEQPPKAAVEQPPKAAVEQSPKAALSTVTGTPAATAPRPAAERPVPATPATVPKEEDLPAEHEPPKRRWFGVFGGGGRTQPLSVTGARR